MKERGEQMEGMIHRAKQVKEVRRYVLEMKFTVEEIFMNISIVTKTDD